MSKPDVKAPTFQEIKEQLDKDLETHIDRLHKEQAVGRELRRDIAALDSLQKRSRA